MNQLIVIIITVSITIRLYLLLLLLLLLLKLLLLSLLLLSLLRLYLLSCAIYTHTPARKSSTNFQLYYFVIQFCSTNWLGHGHGYKWHSSLTIITTIGPREIRVAFRAKPSQIAMSQAFMYVYIYIYIYRM